MDLERPHRDLFTLALAEPAQLGDLVNQALEASELEDGSIESVLYDIPAPD